MDAKEIEDVDVSVERASQCCTKCLEWEQRFSGLKLEFERKMSEVGPKLESWKTKDEDDEQEVTTGDVEDNRILELMLENRVLECEKKKAERDVQVWQLKCKELERRVMELEQGMASKARECSSAGMTGREETNAAIGDTFKNVAPLKEGEGGSRYKSKLEGVSRARMQLLFGEGMSGKRIGGVGPASHGVIDISDSDAEAGILNGEAKKVVLESDEVEVAFHKQTATKSTHKRKRALKRITSDSESDNEDCLPVSRLRTTINDSSRPVTRRREVRLGNSKANRTSKESSPSHLKSMKTDKCTSDEDELESEGKSLDGFIVNDSDISDTEITSRDVSLSASDSQFPGDSVSESGDDSDSDSNYNTIIARIGRCKDQKWNWKFLADMQAAFGKDPELCMRAVCTLYRKQTTVEKYHKATILRNGQGFSQCDAFGGSKLGEFLTDGDPEGDLNKSVEELEEYDRKGVEKCRKLAFHYSDQLFKSYQSGEDPLWLPSESKKQVIKPDDDEMKLPSSNTNICSTQPPGYNHLKSPGMPEPSAVTPPGSNLEKPLVAGKNEIMVYCRRARARKELVFREETGARRAVQVNDELGHASELIASNDQRKKLGSGDLTGSSDPNDEDNVFALSSVSKRKRASTVFDSDSECDSEDNIPISRLRKESKMDTSSLGDEDGKPHVRKHRLVRLRNLKKGMSKESSPSHIKCKNTEHPTDNSCEDGESETKGESWDDFIKDDSEISNSKDDPSSADSDSGCESDGNIHYGDIIAKLGRQDDQKRKWEYQADMLADFGKNPELLLRAVCALYRRQTWEEKELKETLEFNGVGFSQYHAFSGSKLGEFLTDGNPEGDLKKSVKELEEFYPWGLATCDKLAFHYAGQLFRLYQSGEDPLWLPSEYRL